MLILMSTDRRPPIAYSPRRERAIDLAKVVAVRDFEGPARDRLHPAALAYYEGGAWDGVTVRQNEQAWDRWYLRPRVLTDVSRVSLETAVLGRPVALPIGVAPAALHGLAHADADLATARAAAAAGAINVVSTMASRSIEEVADAAPDARRWFQLYVQADWSLTRSLVERAAAAGYEALVLTVDTPVLGYRDEVLRLPFDPGEDAYANLPKRESWSHGGVLDELLDLRGVPLAWDRLDEIRSWAPLPLVLKGILTAEDARIAVDHGVDAVWVSNHGGRQLDRSPAAIDVLEEVVGAVEGRTEVYLDGGIRRGPDVLIALALGASAVFAARPFLYALACAGEEGVARAFEIYRAELDRALAITGVTSPAGMARAHVGRR
jgi:isopentenyl diphosphate isomerase/L-lactate dehydrogenase-like FMN-dependent dehydrogenase